MMFRSSAGRQRSGELTALSSVLKRRISYECVSRSWRLACFGENLPHKTPRRHWTSCGASHPEVFDREELGLEGLACGRLDSEPQISGAPYFRAASLVRVPQLNILPSACEAACWRALETTAMLENEWVKGVEQSRRKVVECARAR